MPMANAPRKTLVKNANGPDRKSTYQVNEAQDLAFKKTEVAEPPTP
jgi:hypothetical protein